MQSTLAKSPRNSTLHWTVEDVLETALVASKGEEKEDRSLHQV